jgi:hypothetical protein
MRRLMVLMFVLSVATAHSQDSNGTKPVDTSINSGSAIIPLRTVSQQELEEMQRRNIDSIVRMNEENRAKQKRAAYIRIAIGIGGFIVLIIGLRRKRSIKK